jgi:hypothetical protein
MLAVVVAIILVSFEPISLDTIGIRYARHLEGKPVLATFLIGKPLWSNKGIAAAGTADSANAPRCGQNALTSAQS